MSLNKLYRRNNKNAISIYFPQRTETDEKQLKYIALTENLLYNNNTKTIKRIRHIQTVANFVK